MAVRLSALPPGRFLVLISIRGWVGPRATVRVEGLNQRKNPMTSTGIEPKTFLLVAYCPNPLQREEKLQQYPSLLVFSASISPNTHTDQERGLGSFGLPYHVHPALHSEKYSVFRRFYQIRFLIRHFFPCHTSQHSAEWILRSLIAARVSRYEQCHLPSVRGQIIELGGRAKVFQRSNTLTPRGAEARSAGYVYTPVPDLSGSVKKR
jgi:hypothetical protein